MTFDNRGVFAACFLSFFALNQLALANWDPATGHLHDFKPSDSWLSKNKDGSRCFSDIQVAECAQNTRLHYPHVQLFATFQVDHQRDTHHGCPYGTCCAFTALPSPSDMEVAFTDYHSFFWHNLGGISGTGGNPIADPETGAFGYETSDGKFHTGKADTSAEQPGHDSHYPGFKLPPAWTNVHYPSAEMSAPTQPKCGTPTGPNQDPGQKPGAYGDYKPSPADAYHAPQAISA